MKEHGIPLYAPGSLAIKLIKSPPCGVILSGACAFARERTGGVEGPLPQERLSSSRISADQDNPLRRSPFRCRLHKMRRRNCPNLHQQTELVPVVPTFHNLSARHALD